MNSIGDMAQLFTSRRQQTQAKVQLQRLTNELATGQTTDPTARLGSDTSQLTSIDRSLGVLNAYRDATTHAALVTGLMQTVLDGVQTGTESLANDLITVTDNSAGAPLDATAKKARAQFDSMVQQMNSDVAGRALFAGTATDSQALASPDIILDALRTEIAGATSTADVRASLDAWFDTPGGGFDTLAYQGSATAPSPLRLGENETAALDVRANDPALRELLKETAIAALSGDATLAFDEEMQTDMLRSAGLGLLNAQTGLTSMRADLGYLEQRIEETSVRNSAEKTATEMARNALLSVDPFETVTRLEETQLQLETIYTMTARLSRLSLLEFIR